MNDTQKIVKLAVDHAQGSLGQFSADEAEHTLRAALNTLAGGKDGQFDAKAFRRNKLALFEVMEEVLDAIVDQGITNNFDAFVEIKNVKHGDKPVFMIEDNALFNVATIASGTNNLRRQRIDRTSLNVSTNYKGVKIYEELERFLAGRVDWAKLVNRVQQSFIAQIGKDIFGALKAGYQGLSAPYAYTGTFDLTQFNTLVSHVEAATNRQVMVAGTKLALQKVTPAYVAYNGGAIDLRNKDGYFKIVDGVPLLEIKQAHDINSTSFAIDNNFLLVIPSGEEKIVKMVVEGDSEIKEVTNENADESLEYVFKKKYGVGVITANKYGVYNLS